jgi:DNA-binding MarR family transcriptional regulator
MSEIDLDALRRQSEHALSRKLLAIYRNDQALAAERYAARGYQGLGLAHTFLIANLDAAGTRIVDLAERTGTTKQFAGRIVQELLARGLVETSADPTDRRATLVRGTDWGWQFLAEACAVREEIDREYATVLGEELLGSLMGAIDQLLREGPQGGAASAALLS